MIQPLPDKRAQHIADLGNSLSISQLKGLLSESHEPWFLQNSNLVLTLQDRSSISEKDLESCYNLLKGNLQSCYENSSWGWHPDAKKAELREPDTKYLLLHSTADGQTPSHCDVLGFLSCQIVVEKDEPVIYCYELQLSKALRGLGIGSRLMFIMHELGKALCMKRAFLTVFTSNECAYKFYAKLGYTVDPQSPKDKILRGRTVRPDYRILSKKLKS